MKTGKDWEEIEKYLEGKLSVNETNMFETKLQADSELLQLLLAHKKMNVSLNAYGERVRLKQKLEQIHQDTFAEMPQNQQNKLKIFWIQHYKTMAVAASVSLLVAISTILYINFQKVQIRQSANFKALRKDMDRIN